MADVKLSNIANVTGTYDSVSTALSSEEVITSMITGLTIEELLRSSYLFFYINSSVDSFQCISVE